MIRKRKLSLEVKMTLSSNLKRIMREKGIDHNELAVEMGVPQSTIRNWREGRHIPGGSNLVKLTKVLGLDSTRLLTEENNEA